jgi:SAM-dependent methyltransferase
MIEKAALYSGKDILDPWGQQRGLQIIRRKNIVDVLNRIIERKYDTAVDIACGTGELSLELSKFSNKLLLLDYSQDVLEVCKKNTNNQFRYNLNTLPNIYSIDEKKYNILYAIEVIYYLNKGEKKILFANIKKTVAKDGLVIMTLSEDDLSFLKNDFEIIYNGVRFKSLFGLPDIFYRFERFVNILLNRNRVIFSNNNKPSKSIWMYILLILYPLVYPSRFFYKSKTLAYIFYQLGKLFNVKHERNLIIARIK